MDEKDIISTDFNYDVYSGGNAKKYLDEYNAQKKREREEAAKSDAEKRRDEYRKRFEGMSADELFDQPFAEKHDPKPEPQPSPEELLDDDAGIKNELPELTDLPTLEPLMDGEEEPDSLSPDQKLKTERYNEGVAQVNEMLASARYRRDYQSMIYGRSRGLGLGYPLGYSAFTNRGRLGYRRYRMGGRRFNSREERAAYIYFTCVMLGVLLALSLQMPFGMYFLLGGAAGAVSSVIRRMVEHGHSLSEAIAASRLSIIVAGVAALLGIFFSF